MKYARQIGIQDRESLPATTTDMRDGRVRYVLITFSLHLTVIVVFLAGLGCRRETSSAPQASPGGTQAGEHLSATPSAAEMGTATADRSPDTRPKVDKGNNDRTPVNPDAAAGNQSTDAADDNPEFRSAQLASWQEIQQFIHTHKGKVVVVDLWSTSCAPCLRELPHLVTLQTELKQTIVAVSVSLDYFGSPDEPPASYLDKVNAVLRRIKAQTQNFLCTDPDAKVLTELQMASIPIVLVYDARGQLVKAFNNDRNEYGREGFTYEQHIVPFVRSLLGPSEDQ